LLYYGVGFSQEAKSCRCHTVAYKSIASHVHISTAVKPSTEMRRKLRCKEVFRILNDGTTSTTTYPQLLCLANTSHVMLVSDRANLVGLWRVFRDQIEVGVILCACHDQYLLLKKSADSQNDCRKNKMKHEVKIITRKRYMSRSRRSHEIHTWASTTRR